MALNINETYAGKEANIWLSEMFGTSPTFGTVSTVENVKGKMKLPRLFSDDDLIQEATCEFDAQSDLEYEPREIEVDPLSVQIKICHDDLNNSSLERYLGAGSNPGILDMTLQDKIMAYVKAKVAEKVETLLWRGNKATGAGYLALMDGFLAQFTALSVSAMPAAGVINAANYETMMGNFIASMPQLLLDHAMDPDFYIAIPTHLRAVHFAYIGANNLVAARGADWSQMPMFFDGIQLKVLSGLPSSHLVASKMDNLYAGTDLTDDMNTIVIKDMFEVNLNKEIRIRGDFKLGTTVGIADNTYYYKPA